MKYAVEMGSVTIIYMPRFIKFGSGIQKLTGEDSQTHRHERDLISLLLFYFFQNKQNALKR
jgi:hypothetical protein